MRPFFEATRRLNFFGGITLESVQQDPFQLLVRVQRQGIQCAGVRAA